MRRAAAVFLLFACTDTKEIKLTFGSSMKVPFGFRCRDDKLILLANRAVHRPPGEVRISLLVDFIGLPGLPSCRPTEVINFCMEHGGCTALTDPPRICFDRHEPLPVGESAALAVADLVRGLEGEQVTDDAPHQPVLVRVIASAQTCAEIGSGQPKDEELVGCAISCPVQLGGVDGDILLELPTLTDRCSEAVVACAQPSIPNP